MRRAYHALLAATRENTERFALKGVHAGKVVSAHDGDTCRVALAGVGGRKGPPVAYVNVRLLGYDAPEMKKEQLAYGKEVKAVLETLVLGKLVFLDIPETKRPDPYGRVLAHVHVLRKGGGRRKGLASRLGLAPPAPGGGQGVLRRVRQSAVRVPETESMGFRCFRRRCTGAPGLLHVNEWMIQNAGVKPYDGSQARTAWSPEELRTGYGLC